MGARPEMGDSKKGLLTFELFDDEFEHFTYLLLKLPFIFVLYLTRKRTVYDSDVSFLLGRKTFLFFLFFLYSFYVWIY